MAEFFFEYGLFFLKSVTVLVVILIAVLGVVVIGARNRHVGGKEGSIELTSLNEAFDEMKEVVEASVLDKDTYKLMMKDQAKKDKKEAKERKKALKKNKGVEEEPQKAKKRVYVIDFDGDIRASEVEPLREEISAILTFVRPEEDEVVLRLESSGGLVHTYGLAASQLERIRAKGVPLTICVDEVAASGGYMMACLADKLLAAPFAILGSIGVVAQLPNFHRVLKKHDVDYEMFTAGEYKRTVTMFGENTEKGKQKFVEELEDTHELFKDFVAQYRPQLDMDAVATGEIWFGKRAIEQKLVDELSTSDDYLMQSCENADVYRVRYEVKKSLQERISEMTIKTSEGLVSRLITKLSDVRLLVR